MCGRENGGHEVRWSGEKGEERYLVAGSVMRLYILVRVVCTCVCLCIYVSLKDPTSCPLPSS